MIQRAVLLLLATAFIMTAHAASHAASAPPLPALRYGDNAAWAIRNFDNSAWPQAQNGTLPASALASVCPSPPQFLALLNREMVRLQKGGFIICLCARIAADGNISLAKAGHLAPYRNREEVAVASGQPLGIVVEADYCAVQLAPGDTLRFLSDGVVEAKSSSGELFGFDRTLSISNQSSEEIARAAQNFGQEDDITVLTLTSAEAEILHA